MCLVADEAAACSDCYPDYRWTLDGPGGEYGLWGWNVGARSTLYVGPLEIYLPVSAPIVATVVGCALVGLFAAAFVRLKKTTSSD